MRALGQTAKAAPDPCGCVTRERRASARVLGAAGTGIGAENITTPRATGIGAGAEKLIDREGSGRPPLTTRTVAPNDISAKCSGSISGIMTTFGGLGGFLSPVVTAAIAARFGWSYSLDFAALVTVVSGLAWFLINADQCLE